MSDARALPARSAPAARTGGLSYRYLVLIVVILGAFISILDTTITNIAIPKLEAVFGVDLNTAQWVINAYTLALTVSIPFFGLLADRIGTKRTYMIVLAGFTGASALCGLAWSNTALVGFRVLQGLGGGALLPLGTALIFAEFAPHERGQAIALLGVPILFAPALGPTVGGYLVDYVDWRLIFYINVPIGITALILAANVLRPGGAKANARLDVPGLICASSGFSLVTYGVTLSESDGWDALSTRGFLGAGALFLIALVIVELNVAQPLLDVRLLKNRAFTSGLLVGALIQAVLFGGTFLVPVFLQNLRGQTAFQAGLILLPAALVTVVVLPFGGRLVDVIGAKWVIVMGAVVLAAANYLMSHLSLAVPFALLQLWLALRSVALGLSAQPAQVAAFAEIPREILSRASAFYNVLTRVASAFGVSFLTSYLGQQQKVHYAHLAEQVTPLSPIGQAITGAIQQAQFNGTDVRLAQAQTARAVIGQLQGQAALLSFRDTFIVVTFMALFAALVALIVMPPVKRRSPTGEPVIAE